MAIRPLFSASCRDCSASFGYPSLGDSAYGSWILSSEDGQRFPYVEGFSDFPSRLNSLLKTTGSRLQVWDALASLADQPTSHRWVTGIRCPHCGADKIASWDGSGCGEVEMPDATCARADMLSDHEICEQLKAV